jgi:hypothetical protein
MGDHKICHNLVVATIQSLAPDAASGGGADRNAGEPRIGDKHSVVKLPSAAIRSSRPTRLSRRGQRAGVRPLRQCRISPAMAPPSTRGSHDVSANWRIVRHLLPAAPNGVLMGSCPRSQFAPPQDCGRNPQRAGRRSAGLSGCDLCIAAFNGASQQNVLEPPQIKGGLA